jgi:hypothetical protein
MAVWAKERAIYICRRSDTGKLDTSTHTVIYRPVSVGSSGDISTTQLSSLFAYKPDENLDTEEAYDIYVDGTRIRRILGPDLMPDVSV